MTNICKNWSEWLKKSRFAYMDEIQVQQTLNWLMNVKSDVLNMAELVQGQKIADFGCGTGLLGFGILERFQDTVELTFSDKFEDCLNECKNILSSIDTSYNVKFLQSDIADIKLENNYLDRALTRSVLVHVLDKKKAFSEIYRVLKPNGMYCAFEPIISKNTKYYELLLPNEVSNYFDFKKAEVEIVSDKNEPLFNFDAYSLDDDLTSVGFSSTVAVDMTKSQYKPTKEAIETWFITPPAPDRKNIKERFLEYFDESKVNLFISEVKDVLSQREVKISTEIAYIKAIKKI